MTTETKNNRPNSARSRASTIVAIVCGSIAAGLLFRSRTLPQANLTDQQAKSLGYKSAAEQKQTEADFVKYWSDITQHGAMTTEEYRLAASVLDHGSRPAKSRIIAVLGHLRGASEHKRALDLMPKGAIPKQEWGGWRSSFARWHSDQRDPTVIPMLLTSGNPNAISIADDIKREEHVRQ